MIERRLSLAQRNCRSSIRAEFMIDGTTGSSDVCQTLLCDNNSILFPGWRKVHRRKTQRGLPGVAVGKRSVREGRRSGEKCF